MKNALSVIEEYIPFATDAVSAAIGTGGPTPAKIYTLTYLVAGATPEEVREQHNEGEVVTLKTLEDLGITLPSGQSFSGWVDGGEIITEVTMTRDLVVEGQTIASRPNLIYKSELITGTLSPGFSEDYSPWLAGRMTLGKIVFVSSASNGKIQRANYGAYATLFSDTWSGSSNNGVSISTPIDANGIYILSFVAKHKYSLSPSSINGLMMTDGVVAYNGSPVKVRIDGVQIKDYSAESGNCLIPNDDHDHFVEIVYDLSSPNGAIPANMSFLIVGWEMRYPKLEIVDDYDNDVATPWIPNTND